ncbi:MAG: AMP-binding protein [Myxococcales bacterium]|nr:AMP-binding protein [Myxococcales bacterium]
MPPSSKRTAYKTRAAPVRIFGALDAGEQAGRLPVAFGAGAAFDRADLAQRVSALAAALADAGSGRWLLYTESSYAAAVSLLALARARGTAILAPNRQPETLRRLGAGVTGALLDAEIPCDAVRRLVPLAPRGGKATRDAGMELDRDAPLVELHSSGTTGARKGTVKTLRHLEDEISAHEAIFGALLPGDARIFATVPHQHIYGLLFRLLWPLASGRPFSTENLLHPQELLPRMAESPASALVSTPAHLRRVAAGTGLSSVRATCRAVFSSGSPLDAETAKRVAEQLGFAPHEILGSTETGGVAVRQRSAHGESWLPFPHVEIERSGPDGRLVVTSPCASEGESLGDGRRRYSMGDRIECSADGSFLLLGRADRIVKIGGKRLSLPDMERELEVHAWVDQAALVVFEHGSEPRVHGVIVPSAAGRAVLEAQERRTVGAALAERLAGHFDRVLLPRRWRFVNELPRDAQGKLPAAALRALFDDRVRDPIPVRETRTPNCIEQRLEVPDELAYLEGHFAGTPIVPGVVLLRWMRSAAAELLGEAPRVRAIEALKFPSVLRPGQRFDLRVELADDRTRLRFRAADAERTFASGRCLLGPPEDETP